MNNNYSQTDKTATESILLAYKVMHEKFIRTNFFFNFYPRDAMLARVIEIATCLSVCPSRPKKASGMISSPSRSPKTLVYV